MVQKLNDNEINYKISVVFDLTKQAIVLAKDNVQCLYFQKWGNDFLMDIFSIFLTQLKNEINLYISNGFRSDIRKGHFLKFEKNFFIMFSSSDNIKYKDSTGIYDFDEFKALGLILVDETFSWLIHRDPDFGTISFAYDNTVDLEVVNQLRNNKYYVDDTPKPEFFTDEL